MTATRILSILLAILLAMSGAGMAAAGDQPQHWSGALATSAPGNLATLQAEGARIYAKACTACHGAEGRGDGPGADVLPAQPRDFRQAQYRVRTTESGELPLDSDLYRTISVGFPEYGMPRFAHLSPQERWALVAHLKSLSPQFADGAAPEALEIVTVPEATPASIARGKDVYARLQCGQCHGPDGRGDGPSSHIMVDAQGFPARTRNFHKGPRAFKRGSSAQDVLASLVTGFDGTPMPSYQDVVTDEDLAAVAQYVASLARRP